MEYRENRDVRRPFLATPDSRVYFPAATIERARQATERCLRRGEGIALVVGSTGVGKTILTRVLAASFEAEDLVVVVSPLRKNDVKSFWQQILFGLRQTFCGCDETELRLMTLDYLERSQRRRFVLLVDDAQNLSLRIFDEIRVLVDQGPALSAQISVALVGSSLLEERLNLPQFYPIQQRIAVRSFLDAFERGEINEYLDREMARVDSSARFSLDAKDLIVDLSEGSPRVVNQLSDRALVLAFPESVDANHFEGEIGRVFVERAWANLQNLPEEEKFENPVEFGVRTSDVVEFGSLEDEEEEEEDKNIGKIDAANEDLNDCLTADDSRISSEENEDAEFNGKNESAENENNDDFNDAQEGTDEPIPIPEVKIDWEDERYGSGGANAAENETKMDDVSSTEIDAELEARLLSKFADSNKRDGSDDADEEANDVENSVSFDASDHRARLPKKDSAASTDGVVSEGDGKERNIERKVFNALKSDDFEQTNGLEVVETAKETSKLSDSVDFSSLFSQSKTRRPISEEGDDGSREFEAANGFSVEEAATRGVIDERFWEANLSPDSVSGQTVYSDVSERNFIANPGIYANNDGEFLSLEDRAYRQIVEACRQATSDSVSANDQYLTELSLLEQEIEEEVHLVRKIRNIHLKLRAARGERPSDETQEQDETNEKTKSAPLALGEKVK